MTSSETAAPDLNTRLRRLFNGDSFESAAAKYVFFNLLLLFIRPQNHLRFLGTIYFPLLASLPLFALWLIRPKYWPPQIVAMVGFVGLGAAWVPLALNNRWAFPGGHATKAAIAVAIALPMILIPVVRARRRANPAAVKT